MIPSRKRISKGADQPSRMRRLICTFIVRMQQSQISLRRAHISMTSPWLYCFYDSSYALSCSLYRSFIDILQTNILGHFYICRSRLQLMTLMLFNFLECFWNIHLYMDESKSTVSIGNDEARGYEAMKLRNPICCSVFYNIFLLAFPPRDSLK